MFIYENDNSLNLTFKGNLPVEHPEVIIRGYVNGAELVVNGQLAVELADKEEFEGKAKTFVFQKDNKLNITFRGFEGIDNPEVTLDEVDEGVVDVVVNGTPVRLEYTDESVTISGVETTNEEDEVQPAVTTGEEEPEVTLPDNTENTEEE